MGQASSKAEVTTRPAEPTEKTWYNSPTRGLVSPCAAYAIGNSKGNAAIVNNQKRNNALWAVRAFMGALGMQGIFPISSESLVHGEPMCTSREPPYARCHRGLFATPRAQPESEYNDSARVRPPAASISRPAFPLAPVLFSEDWSCADCQITRHQSDPSRMPRSAFPWPCTQRASLAIQKRVSHRDFPGVEKPICRRWKDIPALLSAGPIRLACKTRRRLNRKEFFSLPACSSRRQSAENALSRISGSRCGLRPFQRWPTLEFRCRAKHQKFLEILR